MRRLQGMAEMRSEQYKKWWNSTDTPERRAKAGVGKRPGKRNSEKMKKVVYTEENNS